MGVAQGLERLAVAQEVAGSKPVTHPKFLFQCVLLLQPGFPPGLLHNVKGLGRTGHELIASLVALSLADLYIAVTRLSLRPPGTMVASVLASHLRRIRLIPSWPQCTHSGGPCLSGSSILLPS